ncbi:hypothetical protein L873DRAFT_1814121, partial [Choiromyces venosus 120613-1]
VLVASPLIQFSKVWDFSLPHVFFFPATNDSTPARQTPLSEFLLSYQEKKNIHYHPDRRQKVTTTHSPCRAAAIAGTL